MSAPAPQHNTYALGGRVALVSGALGGLGPAVCLTLLEGGARVYALVRQRQAADETAIATHAGTAAERLSFVAGDALDEGAVAGVVSDIVGREGRLDILANLVGGFAAGQPVTELDSETFERMLRLNLRPTYLLSKYAVREMRRAGWGRVINVSSRAAVVAAKNAAAYGAAKAAIIAWTQAQAEETRQTGVTVNAILPSIIDTPSNRVGASPEQVSRWPSPEQVARVIAFLASDDAGLVSGASVPVYGLA